MLDRSDVHHVFDARVRSAVSGLLRFIANQVVASRLRIFLAAAWTDSTIWM